MLTAPNPHARLGCTCGNIIWDCGCPAPKPFKILSAACVACRQGLYEALIGLPAAPPVRPVSMRRRIVERLSDLAVWR